MKVNIHQFNKEGVLVFRSYLDGLRAQTIEEIPADFYKDRKYCIPLSDEVLIDIQKFDSKEEMVRYLYPKLRRVNIDNLYYHSPLWSWLAAVFFNSICYKDINGKYNVGASSRYILDSSEYKRYYRHLIASPIRLYHELNNDSLSVFYLYGKPYIQGDIYEQLASRQEFATIHSILETCKILYWDEFNNKPKTGVADKNNPDNLRRLLSSVLPQFQMTYDINAMNGYQILELLPKEFDLWKDI